MKSKKYIFLYYISIVLLIPVLTIGLTKVNGGSDFKLMTPVTITGLIVINGLIALVITYFLIKKKELEGNIYFPISTIIFTIMGFIVAVLFNDRVMVPYVHFNYYASFILIAHLLLGIYTLLGIKVKD